MTRPSGGAEIDLLLARPDGALWAIEVKRSLRPRPERGLYSARADLEPERSFVVYPGPESFPLGDGVTATPLRRMAERIGQGG